MITLGVKLSVAAGAGIAAHALARLVDEPSIVSAMG
jgi:hypothetical protein